MNFFRFRSTAMGHHGRDIPNQPQVCSFGPDCQFLLVAGFYIDEDLLNGMRSYRHTLRLLAVRCVLYPGPAIHCVPVARNWRQNPTGNPGHTARPVHVQQPQDDQTNHIILLLLISFKKVTDYYFSFDVNSSTWYCLCNVCM